jgi:hypothetical protein
MKLTYMMISKKGSNFWQKADPIFVQAIPIDKIKMMAINKNFIQILIC